MCLLLIPFPLAAQTDKPLEISLGVHLEHFDYTELDTDNSVLNNESDPLPGMSLGLEYQRNKWLTGGKFIMLYGNVFYDGQTQSGIPVTSNSEALIMDTEAYVGLLHGEKRYRGRLYAGLGFHYWRRYIRPTVLPGTGQPVSGLLEHYQWWYALLGYKWTYQADPMFDWSLDIQARRMLEGTMEVVAAGFDNATVNLGERWGMRVSVPFRYTLSKNRNLVIEPYLSHWDIGRSNVVPQTINGVPTGKGLVEPRSETRDIGIAVYYRFGF